MKIKLVKSVKQYSSAVKKLNLLVELNNSREVSKKTSDKIELLKIVIRHYEEKDLIKDKGISMDYAFDMIKNACQLETNSSLSDKGLKLTEEVGELAAELLKITGYKHTTDTKEEATKKALLESVDTMIMIFSIMNYLNFDKKQIVEMTESQIKKWLSYIK
jgi:NTP pyrophosphatase (non-canonical NTP hydrolase)